MNKYQIVLILLLYACTVITPAYFYFEWQEKKEQKKDNKLNTRYNREYKRAA